MRVLVFSHMFPTELDMGEGIFVLEQIKALTRLGAEVIIVSPVPLAPRWLRYIPSVEKYCAIKKQANIDGYEVHYPPVFTLPKNRGFAFSGLLSYLWCRSLVRRLTRNAKVDVIHAHTILPDGFAAFLLGKEFGLPVVCTAHGSDVNVYPFMSRSVRFATVWALRNVDRLIAVSQNLRQQMLGLGGNRSVAVVHNGANPLFFKPTSKISARRTLNLRVDQKLIGFVGYLREEKNLENLLEAFSRVKYPDAQLCLVGDGPQRQDLICQARELGILDRCLFAGNQPHDDIPLWLCAVDCLVLCSLSEGLPTILPEAMLCHVPVVATPVGGIPELIRDRETGLLVPCRDVNALTTALEQLLSSSELSQALADRAESFAKTSATWEVNAQQTMAVYEDAVRTSARAGGSAQPLST